MPSKFCIHHICVITRKWILYVVRCDAMHWKNNRCYENDKKRFYCFSKNGANKKLSKKYDFCTENNECWKMRESSSSDYELIKNSCVWQEEVKNAISSLGVFILAFAMDLILKVSCHILLTPKLNALCCIFKVLFVGIKLYFPVNIFSSQKCRVFHTPSWRDRSAAKCTHFITED